MNNIIDAIKIRTILSQSVNPDGYKVRDILAKAYTLGGLDLAEVASLMQVSQPELLQEIFAAAQKVKETIYGKRLVIFAPLYISNLCSNSCLYCAFCASNQQIVRRALNPEEIKRETELLVAQGQKRVLLVAGEAYPKNDFQYVLDAIASVYSVQVGRGQIRRLNVNLAPLPVEQFRLLKQANIGTYQLFQETYDREIYAQVHVAGPKMDYDWRITGLDRAMQAGIDDVGMGVLFGLAAWQFDVLALLQHANYLQNRFGIGPHTISVPRIEPAVGSELANNPPHPVADKDFCKIIAILRLAVPYTGIIMSTRENPEMRRQTFALGVSQISAGSKTNPGGYTEAHPNAATAAEADRDHASQFALGDERSLAEVVRDIVELGYLPSFCTACYRLGRTGEDFMCLAKPGLIKQMCFPNALATFQEYLSDYASAATKALGEKLIERELQVLPEKIRRSAQMLVDRIRRGERDVYV